jgi:OmpA-OmpF porin, OOP family
MTMRLFFQFVLVLFSVSVQAQMMSTNSFQLANSSYDEQHPVLSPDGKTLYVTIGNHPQNIGGKKDPGDIWISRLTGDQWSAPVHGGTVINNRSYNAVAGISANNNRLFLHGHYDPSGATAKTQGISIATDTGNGWSRPVNVAIPYYMNKSAWLSGYISDDGKIFIFSAETYGSLGVEDLYISLNENGKWSEPKNLGAAVNTSFQELSPALSPDQKTLYFSSNGRKGKGGFDIYSATKLDDSWINWSEPVNMGDRINTTGRELYFRPNRLGFALFTSTINSDGYGDLKVYQPDEPFLVKDPIVSLVKPVDSVVQIVELPRDTVTKIDNRVKVYGKVTNVKTGEPVTAVVSFNGPGMDEQTVTSSADGFSILLSASADYSVSIEAKGFISTMEKLDVHTYELKELEMNFGLQPLAIGTTVNLKNVLFAQAKTDILPESFPELDLVVHFLQANPNVRIELSGHTDNRGVHQDNIKLSQQRVNKVKEYLVSKGVEAKRISGKGYGGTKPIASNDTEESRRMNRRVEFTIKRF